MRDWSLHEWLVHACAFAVLRGKSMNVYPMGDEMIVALRPIEGARALYLRWQQSGEPPGLPNEDVWLFADDGIVAIPQFWACDGIDPYEWCDDERANESIGDLMQRQREAAGLA